MGVVGASALKPDFNWVARKPEKYVSSTGLTYIESLSSHSYLVSIRQSNEFNRIPTKSRVFRLTEMSELSEFKLIYCRINRKSRNTNVRNSEFNIYFNQLTTAYG